MHTILYSPSSSPEQVVSSLLSFNDDLPPPLLPSLRLWLLPAFASPSSSSPASGLVYGLIGVCSICLISCMQCNRRPCFSMSCGGGNGSLYTCMYIYVCNIHSITVLLGSNFLGHYNGYMCTCINQLNLCVHLKPLQYYIHRRS